MPKDDQKITFRCLWMAPQKSEGEIGPKRKVECNFACNRQSHV